MNRLAMLRARATVRHFQQHRLQLVLALVGVSIGVAAVTAVDVARRSVDEAFAASIQAVSGRASHRIVSAGDSISTEQYVHLRRTLGWIPMAPVIERAVTGPEGGQWTLLGLDLIREAGFDRAAGNWQELEGFPAASWFAGDPWVMLPAEHESRSAWSFQYEGKSIQAQVAGSLPRSTGGQRLAIADIGTVQAWLGLADTLDAIDVEIGEETGAQALRAVLPESLRLVPRRTTPKGLTQAFEMNLTALSLLTALVGVFIVYNTFNFLVLQRREQFQLEHALGITRAGQRRQVLTEAVGLGLLGSMLGGLFGVALGRFTLQLMDRTVSDLYGRAGGAGLVLEPELAAKALAVGLLSCLLAAWRPSFEIVQRPGRRLALSIAVAVTAIAIGCILLAVPGPLLPALVGVFALSLGYCILGGPTLSLASLPLVRRTPLARLPLLGLSLRRLPRSLDRTLPAVAALTLAVATVLGVGTMIDGFRASVAQWLDQSLSADYYLRSEAEALPSAVVAQIEAWPQLRAVSRFTSRDVLIGGDPVELAIQDLTPEGRRSYGFIEQGADLWARFESEGVLIATESLARTQQLRPGDAVAIQLGGRTIELTVGGVITDYRTGPGRLIISWSAFERLGGPVQPSALGLYLAETATGEALERRVADLRTTQSTLELVETGALHERTLQIFDETFELTRALQWIAALVALIGLTGALAALQLERRRELRLLGALGLTGSEQRRTVRLEAFAMGALVAAFSLPLGWILAWSLTAVINPRAFGWRLDMVFSPQALALAIGVSLLGAWLAGAVAARERAGGSPA